MIREQSDMKIKGKESREKTQSDATGYQEEQERVERTAINRK